MAEKRTRWVIEATTNLSEVNSQLERLIQLQTTQNQLTQQNTTSTALAIQRQREQIEALTASTTKSTNSQKEQTSVLGGLSKEYDTISRQLAGIAQLAAGAWLTGQLKQYVMEVINAKSAQDSFVASLTEMIGSRMNAERINAELMQIAVKSPFSITEIQEVTKRLQGVGVATQDLIPYVNMLGDIAAVVGTNKLPLIAKALTDVQNKGKLMGQEIRQFAENGIPIFDLLAQSMEKPREEVVKLAEAHKITFKDVEAALKKATSEGGIYYNQMAIQAEQLGGQVSNLGDEFELGLSKVGDFFEKGIKGGISSLKELIQQLIGSDSAITRTFETLKAGAALYITYRAAVLTTNAALKANQVETLAGIAAKEADALATVQMTVSTGGLRTAMSGLWAVAKANPLGALTTLVMALYSAYQMWDAVTTEVTSTLGEQEKVLKNQQALFNGAITSTMELKEGTEERTKAVQRLIQQYPEFFKGIDAEKVNNQSLKNIMDSVNLSYAARIDLARQAYRTEELEKKRGELLQQEFDLMERIKKRSPELYAQVNGDVNNLIRAIQKGGNEFLINLDKKGGMLSSMWDNAMNGTIVSSAARISKGLKDIDQEIQKSAKNREATAVKEQQAAIATENARWQEVEKSLKKGTAEYERAVETHNKNVAALGGEAVKKATAQIDEVDKKKKSSLELSLENDVAILKSAEKTYENQIKLLDAEEKLRIEQTKRQIANVTDKEKRILAIHTEYETKRETLMKKEIDKLLDYDMKELKQAEKQSNAIIKQKEKEADEIEDLTLYIADLQVKQAQETADKIREIRKKIQDAEKEGLKLSQELGEKDAVLNKKWWQSKQQAAAEYWEKINKLALEANKIDTANLEETAAKYKKLYGENSEEYQTALLRLRESQNEGKKAQANYDQAVLKTQAGYNMMAVELVRLFEQAFAGIYKSLASGLEGFDKALDGTLKAFDKMKDANKEAMDFILEDTTMTYEQMEQALSDSMRQQAQIIRNENQLKRLKDENLLAMKELEDGYEEVSYGFKSITSALNRNVGDTIANLVNMFSSMARHAKEQSAQMAINWQNNIIRSLQTQKDSLQMQAELQYELMQKKFAIWDEELEKFKATKDAEIAAAQAAIDAQTAMAEQFSSDSQLRLLEDSNYRQSLLILGEQREVESLMAARDRQVQAAQERGATAQEVSDIVNAFEALITQKHQEYADARGNKEKEVSLATQEVKAQETEKVNDLEQSLKDQITDIKNQLAQKEQQLSAQKQAAQEEYANYVKATQGAMYEAERQMAIAQIKIEIASLRGRKTIWNSGKVNSAIRDLEEAMADIQGLGNPYGYTNPSRGSGSGSAPLVVGDSSSRDQANTGDGRGTGTTSSGSTTGGGGSTTTGGPRNNFHGDTWVKPDGSPMGIDSVLSRLHVGERVVPSYLNQLLGEKLTNQELAHGYLQYANFMDRMPDVSLNQNLASMTLPDFSATKSNDQLSLERVEKELKELKEVFRNKSLLNVNIDANAVSISEERQNQTVKYINTILKS